jgi:redox-sensitive bicupin YhaK (pirin superfamily)
MGRDIAKLIAFDGSRFLLVTLSLLSEPVVGEGPSVMKNRGRVRRGFQRVAVRNLHQAKKLLDTKIGGA